MNSYEGRSSSLRTETRNNCLYREAVSPETASFYFMDNNVIAPKPQPGLDINLDPKDHRDPAFEIRGISLYSDNRAYLQYRRIPGPGAASRINRSLAPG